MALYFPPNPTEGQQYVGVNGVTYTWIGDRWSGDYALEQGQASYYIDNGDAFFVYDSNLHNQLNGGNASGQIETEISIVDITSSMWGYITVTYAITNIDGDYDEQGVIISHPGDCNYESSYDFCESQYSTTMRVALRVNNNGAYIDCGDAVETNIVDGTFVQSVPVWYFSNQTVDIRTYVKQGQDILYSNIQTYHAPYVPCFIAGTQITLADGSKKPIEAITYEDELLVWDFDQGVQSKSRPLWIKRPQSIPAYNLSKYADGTELGTLQVVRGHRIYNKTQDKFTFVGETAIGDTIAKANGETTLVSVEHIMNSVVYYNIFTDYHMNLYANDILTSTGFNNLYPIKDMRYIKEARPARQYTGIASYWISGLRLEENITEDVADMAKHLAMLDKLKVPNIPKYHWHRDSLDSRDHICSLSTTKLPSQIDLRTWASSIEDQGQIGSCTGNAIASAIELIDRKKNNKALEISRLFIYYQERLLEGTINYDAGAYIRDGFKATNKYGAPLESLWPYTVSKWATRPSVAAYNDALKRKVVAYQKCTNFNNVKAALAAGQPVVIGFDVYESFENIGANGIMTYPNVNTEQLLGGHAVCLVGYDDATQRFIARNSWGTSWGDRGYFYMPYQVIQDTSMSADFWTLSSVTNP